ncbi:Pentatricopeptide repeat-containing protein [Arachis hypogaea]|nr:Pentatricopeptide repeat-containing protein [Arachis hypogaea]
MWDAIKSVKKEQLLCLATFASVFSSYVAAGRVHDAVMTFEVMGNYGCVNDVVALNSFLSAVCRDARRKANELFQMAKKLVRADADSYAIFMEGWEREGNVNGAKETFAEMVIEVGWDPACSSFFFEYFD